MSNYGPLLVAVATRLLDDDIALSLYDLDRKHVSVYVPDLCILVNALLPHLCLNLLLELWPCHALIVSCQSVNTLPHSGQVCCHISRKVTFNVVIGSARLQSFYHVNRKYRPVNRLSVWVVIQHTDLVLINELACHVN